MLAGSKQAEEGEWELREESFDSSLTQGNIERHFFFFHTKSYKILSLLNIHYLQFKSFFCTTVTIENKEI